MRKPTSFRRCFEERKRSPWLPCPWRAAPPRGGAGPRAAPGWPWAGDLRALVAGFASAAASAAAAVRVRVVAAAAAAAADLLQGRHESLLLLQRHAGGVYDASRRRRRRGGGGLALVVAAVFVRGSGSDDDDGESKGGRSRRRSLSSSLQLMRASSRDVREGRSRRAKQRRHLREQGLIFSPEKAL